jgi:PAS domain S-box-containing protein
MTTYGVAFQGIVVGLAIWRLNLFELSPAMAANNIITTMSDMLAITDAHGNLVSINTAVTLKLGYSESDLLRRSLTTILHAENAAVISPMAHSDRTVIQNDISHAMSVGQYGGKLIAKDGRAIPAGIVVTRLMKSNHRLVGYVVIARDMTDWKRAEEEKSILIAELQDALSNIKSLKGMIPICSSCKKVRNDRGSWQMVEEYICEHSEADFSHGICDDCLHRLYPDYC